MVMPYLLEKGPAMTYLEEFLNGDLATVVASLDNLRFHGAGLFGVGGLFPGDPTLETRLRTNWFGQVPAPAPLQGWMPQPPLDPNDPRPTGYWLGFYGDVERIFCETVIRAVEVSLGIDHGQPVPVSGKGAPRPPRRWPIELFWKCSNPWYEGWVTWRRQGSWTTQPWGSKEQHAGAKGAKGATTKKAKKKAKKGKQRKKGAVDGLRAGLLDESGGQVTVVFASPGDTRNRLIHDSTAPPHPWGPAPHDDMVHPVRATTRQGMWVVSHRKHSPRVMRRNYTPPADAPVNAVLQDARLRFPMAFNPLAPGGGAWEFPQIATLWEGNTVDGRADVVVVAPPFVDGGVSSSAPPWP